MNNIIENNHFTKISKKEYEKTIMITNQAETVSIESDKSSKIC